MEKNCNAVEGKKFKRTYSLKENVPGVTKTRRLNEIIALQNKLSAKGKMKDIGRTYQVLVEGYSKKSDQYLYRRDSQNKVIVFPAGKKKE